MFTYSFLLFCLYDLYEVYVFAFEGVDGQGELFVFQEGLGEFFFGAVDFLAFGFVVFQDCEEVLFELCFYFVYFCLVVGDEVIA